jgi:predicted metal-dependent hydrolase
MKQYKHKDVKYTLKNSKRKTLSIYIERDFSVSVLAPKGLDLEKINKIVDLKRYWIHKSISELKELNKTKANRSIIDGEGFLFLGNSYRLKINEDQKEPIKILGKYLILNPNKSKNPKKSLIEFYKDKGNLNYKDRIEIFSKKMGVNPKQVRTMNLKNRWASNSNGNLNFHWKLAMAPQTIIDYIIVHELAHLQTPKHNNKFWEIVESMMPDYNDRKNWLKINGANLDV